MQLSVSVISKNRRCCAERSQRPTRGCAYLWPYISGYYVSPELWEALAAYQEDIELAKIALSKMKGKQVKVGLDEL